uniref:fasciclin domain-containing protein n=1 Tax=Gelidibacter sp. TaxID=2018083 RepID=UPI004049773C
MLQSCSNDDDNNGNDPQPLNIVETAIATPQLSSLVAALQAADGNLVNVLSGSGPFTVLAPTDAAFASFLSENGFASLDDVPTDVLSQILLNHVIAGNVTSTNLTTAGSGYASTSATGPGGNNLSLYFNTASGVEFNGISSVIAADISATNGTVHIVDAVIGIPTVVTHAAANPNFTTLVSLLDQQGLVATLDGTASSPFTVFAPSNDAFTTFETENPGVLASLTSDQVTSVLTYHVVAGANVLSTGIPAGPITTLETGTFTITGTTINDEADRDTNIVAFDVQGTNGVIHVISNVLLPQL